MQSLTTHYQHLWAGRIPGKHQPALLRNSHTTQMNNFIPQASSSSNGASPAGVPSTSTPRDYSVSLFDALKFNGPAPELINGRLAMLGLVAGAWEETQSGLTIAQQAAQLPLSELLLLALWVWASLVPILKGAKMEAFGWFSPRAEITNGRAAMLGLAVLLFLEDMAGVPFF